ncbi:hypothetical protein CLOP_g8897 [Closterium sp. NIES-67]|nr:hypothetical protein CLOP_g8897 [Closterium sp. NIES-67]
MAAKPASDAPPVPRTLLPRIHSDSVLCCHVDASDCLLATGSEDGSMALCDIRAPAPSPPLHLTCFGGASVPSLLFLPAQEHVLAAAAGSSVFLVDRRKAAGGSSDGSEAIIRRLSFNADEINALAVDRKGDFLAAADDSGQVKVVSLVNHSLHRTLRGVHSSICSSVLFHPKQPWQLFSAGLDCCWAQWDFASGRPLRSFNLSADTTSPSAPSAGAPSSSSSSSLASSSRMCNPPFIHSLSVHHMPPVKASCVAENSTTTTTTTTTIPSTAASTAPAAAAAATAAGDSWRTRGMTLLAVAQGDGTVAVWDADADLEGEGGRRGGGGQEERRRSGGRGRGRGRERRGGRGGQGGGRQGRGQVPSATVRGASISTSVPATIAEDSELSSEDACNGDAGGAEGSQEERGGREEEREKRSGPQLLVFGGRMAAREGGMRGHCASVSAVTFCRFAPPISPLLASGGNDRLVLLWDVTQALSTSSSSSSSSSFSLSSEAREGGGAEAGDSESSSSHLGGEAQKVAGAGAFGPILRIQHGRKVNFLTTSSGVRGRKLFVADTSKRVSVYDIPS